MQISNPIFVLGDEVIEWNGRLLQGKSYQEVSDIIAESKHEADVELIVSRSMGSRRAAQATWRQSVAHRGMMTFNIEVIILVVNSFTEYLIAHIKSCFNTRALKQ